MTLRINELNALDALYQVARRYPGGVEALAVRLGMSSSMLYKKLEGARTISFETWCTVMALCSAAKVEDAQAPLHALAWRFDHVAVKLPDLEGRSVEQLADLVVRAFKEGGDVAGVIQKAVASGGISPLEFADIDREIEQAIGALAAIRENARARVRTGQSGLKAVR